MDRCGSDLSPVSTARDDMAAAEWATAGTLCLLGETLFRQSKPEANEILDRAYKGLTKQIVTVSPEGIERSLKLLSRLVAFFTESNPPKRKRGGGHLLKNCKDSAQRIRPSQSGEVKYPCCSSKPSGPAHAQRSDGTRVM